MYADGNATQGSAQLNRIENLWRRKLARTTIGLNSKILSKYLCAVAHSNRYLYCVEAKGYMVGEWPGRIGGSLPIFFYVNTLLSNQVGVSLINVID